MNRIPCLILAALLLTPLAGASAPPSEADRAGSAWLTSTKWGDQGDGTYRNPVIPGDFPDIDCIRVGSDYYAVSSTIAHSPGFTILHSKDLVNWSILGHAVPNLAAISPDKYIWAGAIRHHNGNFWIYFGTPGQGYFVTTATDPAGPWAPLHRMAGLPHPNGWDDCCPFWDDDGQGYLVGTCFKDNYKIHLWKMTPDNLDLVPESDRIIHQSAGSEANKLYKINGTYYHFYSDCQKEGRVMMMKRASSINGPWSAPRQLAHGQRELQEPNQGGLVQTEQGAWYFFTHHGSGLWEGRYDSLLPVTWLDGWPVIGAPDGQGIGCFVFAHKKPVDGQPVVTPQTNDEFDQPTLAPQWHWDRQPPEGSWSLTQRPGWLRLGALRGVPNSLQQRAYRTAANEVVAKLDARGMADGQECGLRLLSGNGTCASVGVVQQAGKRNVYFNQIVGPPPQPASVIAGPELTGNDVWLKTTWNLDGLGTFAYSLDGKTFASIGASYQMSYHGYVGGRVALFSTNAKIEAGYADFDFFHYDYDGPMNRSRK